MNFALLSEGGSSGKIKFTGCRAIVAGVVQAKCEPHSGVVETMALKDLIVLHSLGGGAVDTLDRIEPEAGDVIAIILSSIKCAVGESIAVKGKFFVKDCKILSRPIWSIT